MKCFGILGVLFVTAVSSVEGSGDAYPRTEPGVIELKTLPAGTLLESEGTGSYFEDSNRMFGPLFRYISRHDISMTSPVEARMNPGAMYFWVREDQVENAKESEKGVKVVRVPERLVASLGARGGYGKRNYDEAETQLLEWLESQDELEQAGEPFGVFWNGPFTPSFLKKFEVQVPVRKLE